MKQVTRPWADVKSWAKEGQSPVSPLHCLNAHRILPPSSLVMSQSQSGKHCREMVTSTSSPAGTVPPSSSPASAAPAQSHTKGCPQISDVASPPKKKHRDVGNDTSTNGEPELVLSGGDEATNGSIQAVASVARCARILSAEEKHRCFKEKYQGMSPEEILGELRYAFLHPEYVLISSLSSGHIAGLAV